ncbi:hypothetical protein Heshes_05720 [Alicyclobacillus hesperidum]|uniref:Uncharacterized protein n=1 Tax=Alicyclobacillus hesperidum TaxID=89784 RepID=A0AA37U138_9BACL|nr:hypothetical protein Heshes_05720 [Alicyclobacillus hesperidum]
MEIVQCIFMDIHFCCALCIPDARYFHAFRYLYSIGVHHVPLWLPLMRTRNHPYELRQPGEELASPG